jgi:polyhydroxybutyrate depolymerase
MNRSKKALTRRSAHGRTWLAVLVTLLVLAACAGPAQARWFGRSDDSSLPSKEYAIKSGGLERTYRLYVPPSYSGKSVPLLVALHPALSDGAGMEKLTRFDALADRYGFIVAYPDGVDRRWNAGRCCGRPMEENINDVGFIDDMVDQIEANYAIDTSRKYVAGFSNGAFLAHHIACVEPDAFTAYAVTGGAITDANCPDAQPTPILLIHGTKDPRSPWNGGTTEGVYRPPVVDLARRLARRNHCSDATTVSYASGPATCKTFSGCGSNEVTYCALDGVGHQWAGARAVLPLFLGPSTDRFSTTDQMWSFFQRHQRPTQYNN